MSDFSPLDAVDRMIIDTLQGDFPLSPTPYADAALALDISEDAEGVIMRIPARSSSS